MHSCIMYIWILINAVESCRCHFPYDLLEVSTVYVSENKVYLEEHSAIIKINPVQLIQVRSAYQQLSLFAHLDLCNYHHSTTPGHFFLLRMRESLTEFKIVDLFSIFFLLFSPSEKNCTECSFNLFYDIIYYELYQYLTLRMV